MKLPVPFVMFCMVVITFFDNDTAIGQYVRSVKFAAEQQRRLHYDLDDWISYSQARRFTSMAMGTHYVYIGTRDGGILRYHIFDNIWDYPFTTSNGLPSNYVKQVIYDKKTGFLWAVTPNDVAVFNAASQEWIRKSQANSWFYEFPLIEDSDKKNQTGFFYGREDLRSLPTFFADGEYSLLTEWKLLDANFQEFPITGYLRDLYDRIWFLVEGFGIGQGDFYSRRAQFYPVGLPAIAPRSIAYQGDDLWLGGHGQNRKGLPGIALWPYNETGWVHYQAQWISRLPNDDVNAIAVRGDSVWFATEYGVSLYDSSKNRWKNFNLEHGLISNSILDLAIMQDYLYVGTDQGISRISLLTGNVERIKDKRFVNISFNRFAVQGDTLWAATYLGIFRFAESFPAWEFVAAKAAIQDLNVTAVGVFENEIWFAANSGIMFLDLRTGIWKSFPQISFEIDPPYSDIKVNEDAVWVASRSGLLKFDKKQQYWRLFSRNDGLLNNVCRQLLLDGDYIWIVNDSGITRFYWNSPQRSY